MNRCLSALLVAFLMSVATGYAQDARVADRLKAILARSPESDANGDGVLSVEEARAFLERQRQMKRPGRRKPNPSRDEDVRVDPSLLAKVFVAKTFQDMPYRWLEPETLEEGRRYPLVLVLHGAGGKGSDNRKNLGGWLGPLIDPELRARHPAFIAVPQSAGIWGPKEDHYGLPGRFKEAESFLPRALSLIDALLTEKPIDPDRIYVLGGSMGGYGTWSALNARPELFAAAVPICGGHPPENAARFKHVPIWAFHGADDERVPTKNSREMFEALEKLGGVMKYTELGGIGHGASGPSMTYRGDNKERGWITRMTSDTCDPEPNVWDWLFGQRRSARP